MLAAMKVTRVVMDDEAGGKPDPGWVSLAMSRGPLLLRALGKHQKVGQV